MVSLPYVVVIPSYKRAALCRDKTLAMLKHHKIPPSRIYVFVANEEEKKTYDLAIPKSLYGHLVVGRLGIVQQREFIERFFPKGQRIMSFDDDIAAVDFSCSAMFKTSSLHAFIQKAFSVCQKEGATVFGVYPVLNHFFLKARKEEYTLSLAYIATGMFGYINDPGNPKLKLRVTIHTGGQKEDVERSILYYLKDGKVVRFNRVAFKTKCYGVSGGLGTFQDRLQPMKEATLKLQAKYPEYGRIKVRPSGMYEFALKRLPPRPATR